MAAGLLAAGVLVLAGVGLGTLGATVIGMSRLAELQAGSGVSQGSGQGAAGPEALSPGAASRGATTEGKGAGEDSSATGPSGAKASDGKDAGKPSGGDSADGKHPGGVLPGPGAAGVVLGVEAADAPDRSGALLVSVHLPGPGHTAGLVRGDVLTRFGGKPVRSAADLVTAVSGATPGTAVTLSVRHEGGNRQNLSVVPAVTT